MMEKTGDGEKREKRRKKGKSGTEVEKGKGNSKKLEE